MWNAYVIEKRSTCVRVCIASRGAHCQLIFQRATVCQILSEISSKFIKFHQVSSNFHENHKISSETIQNRSSQTLPDGPRRLQMVPNYWLHNDSGCLAQGLRDMTRPRPIFIGFCEFSSETIHATIDAISSTVTNLFLGIFDNI